jgi:hypothetical protein
MHRPPDAAEPRIVPLSLAVVRSKEDTAAAPILVAPGYELEKSSESISRTGGSR